ncbi:MAG: hypothetical protein WCF95_02610 [bacterium]
MRKILKKAYEVLRSNLIIIQPFVFYLLLLSVFLGSVHNISEGTKPVLIIFLVSVFALSCAFLAGWLQLFQAALRNSFKEAESPIERTQMSLGILREFLPAVGRFFIPITIAVILYCGFFFGVMKLIVFLGLKYIGFTPNITPDKVLGVLSDKAKMTAFVSALTEADRAKLLRWDVLTLFMTGAFSYLTMFWFPAIMLNGENAFKAFYSGVKATFGRPFTTLGIFSLYWVINLSISLLGSIAPSVFLVQILNLMLVVFITVYFIMVNFVYFEEYSGNNIAGWTNIFR